MVDLGVRLQQLRMDRNMSQSELGKALNRSKSVISAYENDLRIPPLEVLTEIALIFNVSLDFLVGIDKAEMVSVDGLNDTQKAIIHSLIYEFTNDHSPYPGLTEHQQKLLSQIMVEFSKNNIHRTFAFYCSSPRNKNNPNPFSTKNRFGLFFSGAGVLIRTFQKISISLDVFQFQGSEFRVFLASYSLSKRRLLPAVAFLCSK